MKNKVLFFIAVTLLAAGFAGEKSAVSATPDKGVITAEALEFTYVTPDTAMINFSVETTDNETQKAVAENNAKISKITAALKNSLGKDDSIKTSGYSLRPDYSGSTGKRTGYVVSNTLTVKMKDISRVGKIIDEAVQNGATNVSGLSMTLQNKDGVCSALTQKAVAKAKKDAQNVLAPLGKTIDGVASIKYNCDTNTYYNPVANFSTAKSAAFAGASGTTVEQGDIRVNASVTIDFTIK